MLGTLPLSGLWKAAAAFPLFLLQKSILCLYSVLCAHIVVLLNCRDIDYCSVVCSRPLALSLLAGTDLLQRMEAASVAMSKEGWKVVLLWRASPLFPFGLSNYLFGLSSMDPLSPSLMCHRVKSPFQRCLCTLMYARVCMLRFYQDVDGVRPWPHPPTLRLPEGAALVPARACALALQGGAPVSFDSSVQYCEVPWHTPTHPCCWVLWRTSTHLAVQAFRFWSMPWPPGLVCSLPRWPMSPWAAAQEQPWKLRSSGRWKLGRSHKKSPLISLAARLQGMAA